MEAQMVACVNDSLRLYLYDNACFMCERLVAEFPSQVRPGEPCQIREGTPRQAILLDVCAAGCLILFLRIPRNSFGVPTRRATCTCSQLATSAQTRPSVLITCFKVRLFLLRCPLCIPGHSLPGVGSRTSPVLQHTSYTAAVGVRTLIHLSLLSACCYAAGAALSHSHCLLVQGRQSELLPTNCLRVRHTRATDVNVEEKWNRISCCLHYADFI